MAVSFFSRSLLCFLLTYEAEGISLNVQVPATRRAVSTALATKTQQCVSDYANGVNAIAPGLGEPIRKRDLQVKMVSDRSIVIGAGQGTTATESLYAALRRLEMRVGHSMNGDPAWWAPWALMLQRWSSTGTDECLNRSSQIDFTCVPEGIDAILDTPVPHLIVDFLLSFPRAKVLLTTRPAEEWAAARIAWVESFYKIPFRPPMLNEPFPIQEPCLGWHDLPDLTASVPKLARLYTLHNNFVRCIVPRDQLFEIDVFTKSTDGLMPDLANFLGRPLPANGSYPYCSGGYNDDDLCPMNPGKWLDMDDLGMPLGGCILA